MSTKLQLLTTCREPAHRRPGVPCPARRLRQANGVVEQRFCPQCGCLVAQTVTPTHEVPGVGRSDGVWETVLDATL